MSSDSPGSQRDLLIVGAGLIGTSIGIGASSRGWRVQVQDLHDAAELAARLTSPIQGEHHASPDLVVVAAPPHDTARLVVDALKRYAHSVVTDVASVKLPIEQSVRALGASLARRYVGSHPMAGREMRGALYAQGDMFIERPWIVCNAFSAPFAVRVVEALAGDLGANVTRMGAAEHDAALARVSHAPQIVASALANALGALKAEEVALGGQGLRDMTRLAHSDPVMWSEIAALNRTQLEVVLRSIAKDLEGVANALDTRDSVFKLVRSGREQVERIPGKHGGKQRNFPELSVVLDDSPGELVRLLSELETMAINVEDLSFEHSPRHPVGTVTVTYSVDPAPERRVGSRASWPHDTDPRPRFTPNEVVEGLRTDWYAVTLDTLRRFEQARIVVPMRGDDGKRLFSARDVERVRFAAAHPAKSRGLAKVRRDLEWLDQGHAPGSIGLDQPAPMRDASREYFSRLLETAPPRIANSRNSPAWLKGRLQSHGWRVVS